MINDVYLYIITIQLPDSSRESGLRTKLITSKVSNFNLLVYDDFFNLYCLLFLKLEHVFVKIRVPQIDEK